MKRALFLLLLLAVLTLPPFTVAASTSPSPSPTSTNPYHGLTDQYSIQVADKPTAEAVVFEPIVKLWHSLQKTGLYLTGILEKGIEFFKSWKLW